MPIPIIEATCVSESFANEEIPHENRLTNEDVMKYIAPKYASKFNIAALPFNVTETNEAFDKCLPMKASPILDLYDEGKKYKEIRNIIKRRKKKDSQKTTVATPGKFTITFD